MNINKLNKLFDNNVKLINKFLEIFKTEIPTQLNQLREATEQQDWERISHIAHGLKSQVQYLDLNEIAATALKIEQHAESQKNMKTISACLAQMEAKLLVVVEEIENEELKMKN